jgi:hypothetical protein
MEPKRPGVAGEPGGERSRALFWIAVLGWAVLAGLLAVGLPLFICMPL